MLQFLFILLSAIASFTQAVYTDHISGNAISSDGNSYGYGYSHSGSFSGINPTMPTNYANYPFDQGFDFINFFKSLNRFQENLFKDGGGAYSYSHAYSNANGKAEAFSKITFPTDKSTISKRIQSQTAAVQNNVQSSINLPGAKGGYGFSSGNGGSFGETYSGLFPDETNFKFIPKSGGSGSFTPNGQGAGSFGSIGPGGIHQGAYIFPENPNTPNVNVRFGSAQPDGFKSVFSSSSSYTTNVNGQPKTIQKAITTVNDNGKVTTYTRESP